MSTAKSNLMIHSFTWFSETSDDVLEDTVFTPHLLEKVRKSETQRGITFVKDGAEDSDSITLFYFAGISTTDGVGTIPDIKKGDRMEEGVALTPGSDAYMVKAIRSCYDGSRLHHLEVTLG